jgi:hypothetical protein
MIIEARDQVLITLFFFASFDARTFSSNLWNTYGPFLIDLAIVSAFSFQLSVIGHQKYNSADS